MARHLAARAARHLRTPRRYGATFMLARSFPRKLLPAAPRLTVKRGRKTVLHMEDHPPLDRQAGGVRLSYTQWPVAGPTLQHRGFHSRLLHDAKVLRVRLLVPSARRARRATPRGRGRANLQDPPSQKPAGPPRADFFAPHAEFSKRRRSMVAAAAIFQQPCD